MRFAFFSFSSARFNQVSPFFSARGGWEDAFSQRAVMSTQQSGLSTPRTFQRQD